MESLPKDKDYKNLILQITESIKKAKSNAKKAINLEMIYGYWEVGRYIVEYEQKGELKAEYGKKLLINLSKDLKPFLTKGYSRSNLANMRLCYKTYPTIQALPGQLSWTHIIELLSIEDTLERSFYEKQSLIENWGYRELARQNYKKYKLSNSL
jgi:hypothetical protein